MTNIIKSFFSSRRFFYVILFNLEDSYLKILRNWKLVDVTIIFFQDCNAEIGNDT